MEDPAPRQVMRSDEALAPLVLAASNDPADLRAWRKAGVIQRVRRGAYVTPSPSQGPALDRRTLALARIEAVAAQIRTPYWFSHESAALIWGGDVVGLSGRVHVTQAWSDSSRGDRQLVRHVHDLPLASRTSHRGLPVTTLERTAIDCATSMPGRRALVVLDSLVRIGAETDAIAAGLRAGHRGVRTARRVVERVDPRSESPGESLARWEILEQGLPTPDLQVEVRTSHGTYRLDLAWRQAKVALEFDGFVKYSGTYGSAADVVFAEKKRQDALEAAGWLVVRITWDDLARPEPWLTRLAAALRTRAAAH